MIMLLVHVRARFILLDYKLNDSFVVVMPDYVLNGLVRGLGIHKPFPYPMKENDHLLFGMMYNGGLSVPALDGILRVHAFKGVPCCLK